MESTVCHGRQSVDGGENICYERWVIFVGKFWEMNEENETKDE